MRTFDESLHPRDNGGKFATKQTDEAPGGTAALPAAPVDAFVQRARDMANQRCACGKQATIAMAYESGDGFVWGMNTWCDEHADQPQTSKIAWTMRAGDTEPTPYSAPSDPNPLVASGQYERSYASEVQPGDVNAFGQTVAAVERMDHERTWVTYTDGQIDRYSRADTTVLVRARQAA